ALVVRDRRTRAGRRAPHLRRTHRLAELFQLPMDELDARDLVWPPPVISHARRRQTKLIAYIRIKVDHLVGVGQVLGLRSHRHVARVVFRQEVAILFAPARDAGRRIHRHGGSDRAALDAWRTGRDLRATDEARPLWSKLSALKSSIVCFCALGPM